VESWRKVWRDGVAPLLSGSHLAALADALERDDPALVQGATTVPPPLTTLQDWPCEGACLLAYAGWRGGGLTSVGEVEEFFAELCGRIDQAMGEPAACRYVMHAWDETPRDTMRAELLAEVRLALAGRPAA
jgi:hypothetical protein